MKQKYIIAIIMFILYIPSPVEANDAGRLFGNILGAVIEGAEEQQHKKERIKQDALIKKKQIEQETLRQKQYQINEMKRVQTALKQLNYYKSTIDGLSGAGTTKAIKSFETDFDFNIDGHLDKNEKSILLKVAKMGFKSHAEYAEMLKAGFNNKIIYEDAKLRGFATREEFKNAKKNGFHTKDEWIDAQNKGFKTYKELITFEIKAVQNLISDLEEFLPTYNGDIDIIHMSKILQKLEPVKKGRWNNNLYTPAQELRDYADALNGFSELEEQNTIKRQKELEKRKVILITDISDMKIFSEQFMRKNLSNSKALIVAEALSKEPKPTKTMGEKELKELHDRMLKIIRNNGLQRKYQHWKSPSSTETKTHSQNSSTKTASTGNSNVLKTRKFAIEIISIQKRKTLGDGVFFIEKAGAGSFYLAVKYKITNISKKPISTWSFPSFYVRDANNTKYNSDYGASTAYSAEIDENEKVLSNLNPGIQMTGSTVFQISKTLFDPKTWVLEIDADKDFRIALD